MVAARCREVAVEWAEGMLLGPALRARLAVDTRFLLRFLPPVHGFRRPRPQARRLPPPDTMLQTRLLAQSEAAGSPECHDWVNGGCVAQK
jgi:hypothetical protein